MIPLSEEEAGRALDLGRLDAPVVGVSIDSRSVRPGDLFVALRGERFDGHDFVEAAFESGAAGAVVEKTSWSGSSSGRSVYVVDDTLAALGDLARAVRKKSRATVFAITGSVGKTGTKDALAAMAARSCRTVATAANQNNEVGVPLTLLSIEPDTEAVVVEMGMRGPGQIASLVRVVEPDVGVITNIHPVHLELLGTLEHVAQAKAELVQGLTPAGSAVVPAECNILQPYLAELCCRVVYFGVGSDIRNAQVQGWLLRAKSGMACEVVLCWPEGEVRVETPAMPGYRAENIVAAAGACYAAGLPMEECAEGLTGLRFGRGRGEVLSLSGICIVDDTYNANPVAVRAALDGLLRLAAERRGRPVAVLGDMLELGGDSEQYHREIGRYAAEIGVEELWGVGERARATVEGYREQAARSGTRGRDQRAGHVPSSLEDSSLVAGLRPGDVILFKASRSMRLEEMVDRVVALAGAGAWATGIEASEMGETEPEETGRC